MESGCCTLWKRAYVVQVLEQLPECLAIAVLCASRADLHHQLSVLPESLYPLASDDALPSIRQQHSLTLDFFRLTWSDSIDACAVLHAATTATSALKRVALSSIPVQNSEHLLQLIPPASTFASDVSLGYGHDFEVQVPMVECIKQLGEALSHYTALTRLKLAINGQACQGFNLEGLIDSLTGLHRLSLRMGWNRPVEVPIPVPRNVGNQPHLT
jgi:hypothetical protein